MPRRRPETRVLDDFSFSPTEADSPADTPLEFHLTNEGSAPHDLIIEDVDGSALLVSGESDVFAVDGLDAGTYRLICSQPGHVDSGMVGALTIGDPDDAGDPHVVHGEEMTPEEMGCRSRPRSTSTGSCCPSRWTASRG